MKLMRLAIVRDKNQFELHSGPYLISKDEELLHVCCQVQMLRKGSNDNAAECGCSCEIQSASCEGRLLVAVQVQTSSMTVSEIQYSRPGPLESQLAGSPLGTRVQHAVVWIRLGFWLSLGSYRCGTSRHLDLQTVYNVPYRRLCPKLALRKGVGISNQGYTWVFGSPIAATCSHLHPQTGEPASYHWNAGLCLENV